MGWLSIPSSSWNEGINPSGAHTFPACKACSQNSCCHMNQGLGYVLPPGPSAWGRSGPLGLSARTSLHSVRIKFTLWFQEASSNRSSIPVLPAKEPAMLGVTVLQFLLNSCALVLCFLCFGLFFWFFWPALVLMQIDTDRGGILLTGANPDAYFLVLFYPKRLHSPVYITCTDLDHWILVIRRR